MRTNVASVLRLDQAYPLGIETTVAHPYVGPRSFEKDQRAFFFGRDEEAQELVSLITAHPVVLLYSQSGAGKTSLLNANLIPRLEEIEQFNVLPPMRVQGQLPSTLKITKKTNIFVLNALMSCCKDDWSKTRPGMSFAEFFDGCEKKVNDYGEPAPIVIIFDQFEELFTSYGGRWADRHDFFVQLGEAMEGNAKKGITGNPLLRVVFCMREDFIAELDPYESLLPEKLRTRFRLEHLRADEALAAITKPLEKTDRSYAKGVAEQLVKNLLKIPSTGLTGTQSVGLYVEPVQLQVVCQSIWEALDPDETVITKKHLDKYGDVSQALSRFYERSIKSVSEETQVKEEALRRWFADVLITPEGTRAPVNRGQEHTGGMPNAAVDRLEAIRLIKGEWKGTNVRWYELAHDRFLEPIRKSNEKWLENQTRGEQIRLRLENKASKWQQGDPLLQADELLEAMRLVRLRIASPSLRTLVDTSRASTQRRRIRFFKLMGVGAVLAAIIFLVMAVYAFRQGKNARTAEGRAKSRLLAYKAGSSLDDDPELSVLLARAAMEFGDTKDARDILRSGLLKLSSVSGALRDQGAKVTSAEFSRDTRLILTRTADNKVRLWDAASKTLVKQIGEDAEIRAAQFSPDGKLIVTGEQTGLARVWDGSTGTLLRELRGHAGSIIKVAFSPDGKYIGTGSLDTTARVWNAANGEFIKELRGHTEKVGEIAFSPDGIHVATEASDSTGRIWSLQSNQSIVLKGLTGPRPVIAFNHDGTLLATESGPKTDDTAYPEGGAYSVLVWDVATGKQKFKLGGHDGGIAGVTFSANGEWIVTCSNDRTARVWTKDGLLQTELYGHEQSLSSASFSNDSNYVVTTSTDKTVRVWDVMDGAELDVLRGHTQAVNSAAFSSNGEFLVTASNDQTVRIWPFKYDRVSTKMAPLLPHSAGVTSAAFSSSGNDILTTSSDGRLWLNTRSRSKFSTITFPIGNPQQGTANAAFSADGQLIVATIGKEAQLFKVADVESKRRENYERNPLQSREGVVRLPAPPHVTLQHSAEIVAVAFSPDGTSFVTADVDGNAVVWNTANGQKIGQPLHHPKKVNSAVFSPDGKTILTACDDGVVRLWNAGSYSFVKTVGQHSDKVLSVGYSPDGNSIVTTSKDSAYVWDARTGKVKVELRHKGPVNNAAFSPDSSLVVTASADKTTGVWDARTGDNITVLTGHKGPILEAVFSPDGQSILTAGDDPTAHIYSRDAFAPYNELCDLIAQRVVRRLTPSEIAGYLNETAEVSVRRRDPELGPG